MSPRQATRWSRTWPWHRWTLRTRMVVAIVALAAVALVIADVAGLTLLRSYLVNRVDRQLEMTAGGFSHVPPDGRGPRLPGPGPRLMPEVNGDVRVYIYSAAGGLTNAADNQANPAPKLGGYATLVKRVNGKPYTVPSGSAAGPWRVIVTGRDDGGLAAIAVSLSPSDAAANGLLAIDVAVTALVLLLLGAAAAAVVRIGLTPLTRMEATASEIAAGDLSRRVEDADPHTESGRLGLALNGMLGRIEAALAVRTASERRLRQFLADASHELRTPLTSIQGFAELYRRGGAAPGPALDEAMGRIEAEAGRMALLVGDLLLLARLDEERPLERRPVDLLEVAADAVRDAHARSPRRRIRLDELVIPGPAAGAPPGAPEDLPAGLPEVLGDEARLRQVATNLVANALQHTPAAAEITVRVGRCDVRDLPPGPEPTAAVGADLPPDASVAVLEVADTGPGLSGEQARRVFERLFRADASRARGTGGAGLGLSIVAAIVGAHGGRVELRTEPGAGAGFRVLLPAAAEPERNRPLWTGADPAYLVGGP